MTDTKKPAPLTLTDLDELERLEREARLAPWSSYVEDNYRGNNRQEVSVIRNLSGEVATLFAKKHQREAALIVTARNNLPQLLALARVGLLAIEIHDDGVISCIGESRATVAVIEAFRDLIDAYKGGLPQ